MIFVLVAVAVLGTTFTARQLNRRRARVGAQIRERLDEHAANQEYERAAEELIARFLRDEIVWADALAELNRRFPGDAAEHERTLQRWLAFKR